MMNWNALYDRLRAEAPALELRRLGSRQRLLIVEKGESFHLREAYDAILECHYLFL